MEHTTSKNTIKALNDVTALFNEPRSNLSREETKRIRKKIYKKEATSYFLKKKRARR